MTRRADVTVLHIASSAVENMNIEKLSDLTRETHRRMCLMPRGIDAFFCLCDSSKASRLFETIFLSRSA
ncbi:hypothetical protein EYR41_005601 [Orbilia oligospora]|uniref:Uncharacterized protein n=1 Tax=Orbilia oligospora TaxID=2813651 RepID=A0A7C8PM19_ORBOL|nr:hypothetical protein TWF751_009666 [Orbilia oligospora]KAF3262775.1 hypothetical protein TWF128_002513 [Orbilia oligospora]KAF3285675.1 hypothetical protein TWF132_009185 [Orbilia oligospora]TGJ69572.1 hypothetical protein EYR41_005601 [Orbilia oligospora]